MPSFLADTVLTAPEILDVLNNVHEFYDQAWNKLIWALAAIGFVVAILIPWWMERRRKESFDRVQKELDEAKGRMAEFEKEIEKANKERESLLAETMERIQHARDEAIAQAGEIRESTKKSVAMLEGRVRMSLAMALLDTLNDPFLFMIFCHAAYHFIEAEAKTPMEAALDLAADVARRDGAMEAIRADEEAMEALRDVLPEAVKKGFLDADKDPAKTLQRLLEETPPGQTADSSEEEGEEAGQDGTGATQPPPAGP